MPGKWEKLVKRFSEARIPSPYGEFTAYAYQSVLDGTEHLALVKGEWPGSPTSSSGCTPSA